MENEEIEDIDFCEWWEMLDDIEQGEYNRCKQIEEIAEQLKEENEQ